MTWFSCRLVSTAVKTSAIHAVNLVQISPPQASFAHTGGCVRGSVCPYPAVPAKSAVVGLRWTDLHGASFSCYACQESYPSTIKPRLKDLQMLEPMEDWTHRVMDTLGSERSGACCCCCCLLFAWRFSNILVYLRHWSSQTSRPASPLR